MTSPDQFDPLSALSPLPPKDAATAEAVHALGPEAWWAADIVPLLRPQEVDPLSCFAVLLVMAHDIVIHTELIRHPGADRAVELVVHALRAAAHKSGVWPELVLVRCEGFDVALQDALDDSTETPDIRIYGVTRFSDYSHPAAAAVDAAILDLRHHMDGAMIPDVPAVSAPKWSAWGIPLDRVEAFFTAAAEVYRAVVARRFAELERPGTAEQGHGDVAHPPWRHVHKTGGAVLVIEEPEMCDSLAVLFGEGDALATVMLFTESEDWEAMVESGGTDPMGADVRYPVACISFVEASELWGGLAVEIAAQQWPVAGPAAYPALWLLNAEGGGLTTEYCRLLTQQLEVLARAITLGTQSPLHPESSFHYTDTPTGFVVRTMVEE